MPIYTKKGDKGTTSLLNKQRVWKSHMRVDAYGTLDELNSILGIIQSYLSESDISKKSYIQKIILAIQNDLFSIGSHMANPGSIFEEEKQITKQTRFFEKKIDEMTNIMPRLSNFILPGGDVVASYFQNARTVSRRAERCIVDLHKEEIVEDTILMYINRLSDLFFTLSRYTNFLKNREETIWTKRRV